MVAQANLSTRSLMDSVGSLGRDSGSSNGEDLGGPYLDLVFPGLSALVLTYMVFLRHEKDSCP